MELETAVRLNCNIVHIVWVDNAYNMVEMQEVNKYQRKSGVEFGPIDFKAYAESCGAVGFAGGHQVVDEKLATVAADVAGFERHGEALAQSLLSMAFHAWDWLRSPRDWQPQPGSADLRSLASREEGYRTIWSLRRRDLHGLCRRVTIEVHRWEVTQLRGEGNRWPMQEELEIIRRWADRCGLTISDYAC